MFSLHHVWVDVVPLLGVWKHRPFNLAPLVQEVLKLLKLVEEDA